MAEMGRPKKEIDWDQFEKLCALHCTKPEIAGWFHVSEDTIDRRVSEQYGERFAVIYTQKRSNGKISLRRKLMEMAMGGNTAVAIFLAKNLLGYGDRTIQETGQENEQSKLIIDFGGKDDIPVPG